MSTFNKRIENYKRLQADMLQTFVNKDSDYGDSFGKTFGKYGIVSAMTRMSDKMNRIDNLTSAGFRSHISDSDTKMRVDESIEDTLLDLANYAMLTYLEIHHFDEPVPPFSEVNIKPGEISMKSAGMTTGELNEKAGTALATISKTLEEAQAKGRNKDPEYRAPIDSGEFNRRSIEVNRDGAVFLYPGTDEPLSLEETEDFNNYMNAKISLEDMVNNLYTKIAVPGK